MVRYAEAMYMDGERFIDYCSESDMNYTIYIGEKCKIIINEKCFIGVLYKVNEDENTFILKQKNGEIIKICCSDIDDIFCEEEVGTIK